MPQKPTKAFGHIVFSKDGHVRSEVSRLSSDKERQEFEVAGRFVETFNRIDSARQISDVRQLPEADHDFSASVAGISLKVQVTELVDRSYTFDMSIEEYNAGNWSTATLDSPGQIPRRVDEELKRRALADTIARKLSKHYAKSKEGLTWLLVFSVADYLTEFYCGGVLQVSEGLAFARASLANAPAGAFDEVWFTNLQTRPVRVWPVE